jgi:hypothetical protein
MKPQLQNWTHLADFKAVRARRTEVLVVSRDTDFLYELGAVLRGRFRVRTVDSARVIAPPSEAARWLAVIDTASPADARADVAIMQERHPLAPLIVVTHSPWQWSAALARGNIVAAIAREELRGARLMEALNAAERRLAGEHGVPAGAHGARKLTSSALSLLGLLALDIALAGWRQRGGNSAAADESVSPAPRP